MGILVLLVGAVTLEARRAWQHGELPMSNGAQRSWWKRIRSSWPTLFMLVGAGMIFWARSVETEGFDDGWADAIRCRINMPEHTGTSPLVFYYEGITIAGKPFGPVARYFLVGVYNLTLNDLHQRFPEVSNDMAGFIPHEIWFTEDKIMIDPAKYKFDELDHPISQHYKMGWLNPNCGGQSMKEIKAAGNAFIFARRLK